ncbi:phosphoribosyltransferase [Paenibacillus curdlanolyticus]|nr:phosphoribosyltransferase [Paenibacillus curdlanolyticus]
MYNNVTQPYSESMATHVYNIAGSLKVTVKEKDNPFGLPIGQLFGMAARNNPKRSFLFVSKLLGKHIPIDPHTSLLAGYALALLLARHMQPEKEVELEPLLQAALKGLANPEEASSVYRHVIQKRLKLPVPVKVLGFAETATALGHAVFEAIEEPAAYMHTTRELLADREPVFQFEEEHSHATAHRGYAELPGFLTDGETVILVDDEMTTGKTTLNLIRDMHAKYPRKRYIACALLDWRSEEAEAAFAKLERELDVTIETICLYRGTIEVEGAAFPDGKLPEKPHQNQCRSNTKPAVRLHWLDGLFELSSAVSVDSAGRTNRAPYMRQSGRFGIEGAEREALDEAVRQAAEQLRPLRRKGGRTLVVGTGEFMYVPMRIAAELGEQVYYQSTTRSPIHPLTNPGYAVHDSITFLSPDDANVRHYLYNTRAYWYDEVMILLERETPPAQLFSMLDAFREIECGTIHVVICTGAEGVNTGLDRRLLERIMAPPDLIGSYTPSDVTFLLKDLRDAKLEMPTEDKEEAIQSGVHYSEMLPAEYEPSEKYLQLFHDTLEQTSLLVARDIAAVAELIVRKRGLQCVLVSLARAGTPIGVLIKRYIERQYGASLPHYSISIIRGKGIDENALLYILQRHGADANIQFVDGWTGKGAIRRTLIEACDKFEERYGIRLNDDLAVLADPGYCSETFGTREDYLIPSACLNATVSGLVSRTVLKPGLIGPDDYHGAKFYAHWRDIDQSNHFLEQIERHWDEVARTASAEADKRMCDAVESGGQSERATWRGLEDIRKVQAAYGIDDMNLVKPGVGETSRVLLRRVPWKVLVDRLDNPHLRPILLLAKERGVPVELFPDLAYSCCGIIKPLSQKEVRV